MQRNRNACAAAVERVMVPTRVIAAREDITFDAASMPAAVLSGGSTNDSSR